MIIGLIGNLPFLVHIRKACVKVEIGCQPLKSFMGAALFVFVARKCTVQ